ncbi:hypothetical protein RhiLY_00112 [Ceratobasidium sp. AG-Ba]|nr:hypothetical protein RhiLY_00112 [Ceratobasidium sp. AG-Ba]
MDLDDETLRAAIAARGWVLPLVQSHQPAASALATESTGSIVPAALQDVPSTEPAVLAQPNALTSKRLKATAPAHRPNIFFHTNQPAQPSVTASPSVMSTPSHNPAPGLTPASVTPATTSQPVSAPASATTQAATSIKPTIAARSLSAVRSTASARTARRAVSGAPLGASRPIRHTTPSLSQPNSRSATPVLSEPAQNEPDEAELTAGELAVLRREAMHIVSAGANIEVRYIGDEPPRQKGVRATAVKLDELIGLTSNMESTVRSIVKLSLKRTPGVDMRFTITKQPDRHAVTRAIGLIVPFIPTFQPYKAHDYWPLRIIAARLLRHSADAYQSQNTRPKDTEGERAADEQEVANTGEVETGSSVHKEDPAARTAPDRDITTAPAGTVATAPVSPVTTAPAGDALAAFTGDATGVPAFPVATAVAVAAAAAPATPTPATTLTPITAPAPAPVASCASSERIAPMVSGASVVAKHSAIHSRNIAQLTQDVGHMSVDDPPHAANEEEEDLGPFQLPAELTRTAQPQPSTMSPEPVSTPEPQVSFDPTHSPPRPEPSITINSTATSTATSRSISKATSTVTAPGIPTSRTSPQRSGVPVGSRTPTSPVQHTASPPRAPQTPRRPTNPRPSDPTSPDVFAQLRNVMGSLNKDQLKHIPDHLKNVLFMIKKVNPSDVPLDDDAVLAAATPKNDATRPPPYQSDPDNDMDVSSGLSEVSEDGRGLQTGSNPMDIDDESGAAPGKRTRKPKPKPAKAAKGTKVVNDATSSAGAKRGAKKADSAEPAAGKKNNRRKDETNGVAGSSSQGAPNNPGSEQAAQPSRRATRQNSAQHLGNAAATSAPAARKKRPGK